MNEWGDDSYRVDSVPEPSVSVPIDAEESISAAVLRAVAAVNGRSNMRQPVLFRAVDTDALNTLFDGRSSDGAISFRYAGYHVIIHDSRIDVHETIELFG